MGKSPLASVNSSTSAGLSSTIAESPKVSFLLNFSPQHTHRSPVSAQTQRSRTQSQSRYFELELSPILEDAWVFSGNSPTLGTPTAAAGLAPALSIDSCLAGSSDPHTANNMFRAAEIAVAQSPSNAFTQSSSMSCSSFGELLEKVRFSLTSVYDLFHAFIRYALT